MSVDASIWVSLLGAETRFYDVNGVRTRVIQAGDGPDVVLLHGGGGHAEAFARNVVPLSARFRVHALDVLGHGLTDGLSRPVTRADYLAHLLGYFDAAGIDRATVVGESLGGWIATWTALSHPDRVDRLINVCGARLSVPADGESVRRTAAGRAALRQLTEAFLANPTPATVRDRMGWLFRSPERDLTQELVELRWRFYQNPAVRAGLHGATAAPGETSADDNLTAERLRMITRPTLVLWTSHNPSSTAEIGRLAAAEIPGAAFVVMDDCGHWPQWEDPATFNKLIIDYLTGDE